MEFALTLFRVMTAVSGGILCYASLFLYESEEEGVQNILEQWWVHIDDARRYAIARHTALMRNSTALAAAGLERIFGPALVSFRAVAVSACLTVAGILLGGWFVRLYPALTGRLTLLIGPWYIRHPLQDACFAILHLHGSLDIHSAQVALWVGGVFLTAGLAPILYTPLKVLPNLLFVILLLLGAYVRLVTPGPLLDLIIVVCGLGLISDLASIVAVRLLLKSQLQRHTGRILVGAVAQLFVWFAVSIGPMLIGALAIASHWQVPAFQRSYQHFVYSMFLVAPFANLFDSLLLLGFFVALVLLVVHAMLWPLIARSLYRLARFRIFSNPAYRSVLFGCGVSLIGIAFRADMSLIAWFRALLFGST